MRRQALTRNDASDALTCARGAKEQDPTRGLPDALEQVGPQRGQDGRLLHTQVGNENVLIKGKHLFKTRCIQYS